MVINRAFDNIERFYSSVGLMEMRDEWFEILQRKFPQFFDGISNNVTLRKLYVTDAHYRGYKSIEVTPKVRADFCDKFSHDCQLYEFLKKRFNNEYREILLNHDQIPGIA